MGDCDSLQFKKFRYRSRCITEESRIILILLVHQHLSYPGFNKIDFDIVCFAFPHQNGVQKTGAKYGSLDAKIQCISDKNIKQ